MQSVENNLNLVAEILDPLNDAHDIISFVYSLRHEIYEKMNVFAGELKLVISMEFDRELAQWDQDEIKELIKERLRHASQVDRVTLSFMLNALDDLQYLNEMKRLEAGFTTKRAPGTFVVVVVVVVVVCVWICVYMWVGAGVCFHVIGDIGVYCLC
jgi:hypothetical protein